MAFSIARARLLHFNITNQITQRQIAAPIVDARAITAIFALLILWSTLLRFTPMGRCAVPPLRIGGIANSGWA